MIGSNPLYPQYAGIDLTQYVLVSLVALGMALAFIVADRESPTSRALALGLAFVGISTDLNIVVGVQWAVPVWVTGWFGLSESIAMIAILEWILRVRRMLPAGDLNTRTGDVALRIGQLSAVFYAVISVLRPDIRMAEFLGGLGTEGALHRPGFWLFVSPILLGCICAVGALLLLLNRKPDRAERVRVIAMIGAIPLLGGSLVVPLQYSAVVVIVGLIFFLVGAVEYHVLQGQRGQFMSRFLSPQVARLVAERGLSQAMQVNSLDITVVSCDLRGFTAYAQAQPSERVLLVLRDYYDAVGAAVAEFGATIKDYAGDGILILVGAPLPQADHARAGVTLARNIRAAVRPVIRAASLADHPLGLGIGVASGRVTVGVIGSSGGYEYTAVGPAVNLASRLCEQARDGEILVAHDSITHCGQCEAVAEVEPRTPIPIKGYPQPVALFNLPDTAPVPA